MTPDATGSGQWAGGVLPALVDAVHAISGAGPVVSAALAGAGLLLLVLGFRAYRPSAALFVAVCAAGLLIEAVREWHVALPASFQLSLTAAGVVGFALALVWPGGATVVALGGVGALVGLHLAAGAPASLPTTLAAGAAVGALTPALFYSSLPAFVPSAISATLIALGGWAFLAGEHPAALVCRMPAPWLLAAAVLGLSAAAFEGPRLRRARLKVSEATAAAKGAKR